MKRNLLNVTVLLALLPLAGCKKTASSTSSTGGPPSSPPFAGGRVTSFQEVTRQLDPGGSLFLYLATDQWLAGLSTNISDFREVMLSMPGPWNQNRDDIERAFDLVTRLVQTCGVEDVSGVGLSSAPVAPGLFRNRFILHHPSGAGTGFLWSMFGRSPHALGGQEMLPAHTALAAFGDLDVAQVWKVLEDALAQSGINEAAEMGRSFPKMFEKQTTIPWASLLASLGGEIGVVLTLDEAAPISIPAGRGSPIELPGPALLIAVKVNNDLLYTRLSTQFQANPKAVTSDEGGLKICSMPMELPIPIPLQPTVASSGDYFYFATSPELVRNVQAVRKGRQPGLKASAEFQDLAKHLPAEGNQFIYVSRTFGQTVAEVQRQAMRGSGIGDEQMAFFQRMLGGARPTYSLTIGGRTDTGWQTTSVGNQDSASAMMIAPAIGATAIGAGMLLPALAKAKSRAQSISSVNNLKQLGLAARMYANVHKDKLPNAETWSDDLKQFVGNTKVYKAPNDPGPNPCSFAYNTSLGGMDIAKVNPQTVLFFEADGGWNNHGGSELLLARPRSGGIYIIGFADGSVQQIQPARVRSLRWSP